MTGAPATPRLIDRGDLVAALDRAAASKVTVISAPAGSGKTSLLRAWAGRPGQPRRLALVQVQRDQQDAQQFWLALRDAVRHATGANLRHLRVEQHCLDAYSGSSPACRTLGLKTASTVATSSMVPCMSRSSRNRWWLPVRVAAFGAFFKMGAMNRAPVARIPS